MTQALEDLNLVVEKDPTVEEVVGMTGDELMTHALHAVMILIQGGQLNGLDPKSLAMLYGLGFVVGSKYTENRLLNS